MSKETLVNKSETFDEWRLKSNEVSLDLGAVASDSTYTASSLDTESRLTDQYITRNNLGDGGLYIRDISTLPGGLEIDNSGDRTVDNTDGYIILKDSVTTRFPVGALLCQYANNATGSTVLFSATVVSCSNKKILLNNVGGTESFNPTLNLYDSGVSGYTKFIAASYLKELIVESYSHGNVRVYRTRNYQFNATPIGGQGSNKLILSADAYHVIEHKEKVTYTTPASGGIYGNSGDVTTFYVNKGSSYDTTEIGLSLSPGGGDVTLSSGTETQSLSSARLALSQDMTSNGFHISPHNFYVTTDASSIPVTFIEGEVVYQGSDVNNPDFQATLYTADISGFLIFKNILSGTFSSTANLKSVTTTNGAGSTLAADASRIAAANLTSGLVGSQVDISKMIEFNSPAAAGDDYKVYFGSAVDAVLELQDDVGTVENLQTNNSTDLTLAINELELGLRGTSDNLVAADLGSTSGHPAMTADDLVAAVLEHEVDLYGTGSQTLGSLATNNQSNFVAAINELEVGIRGTSNNLVAADLGGDGSPMSADNVVSGLLEHEADLFGAEGGNKRTLSSLNTNDQTSIVDSINELETAIRGANSGLVSTDLGVTLAPYTNSAANLVDHNEELQNDIGDVTNAKLGVLNTPNVSLATHGSAIAQGATVLTMVSNPITAGIKVGMFVTGGNKIDSATGGGSFVTAVSATQVTISRPTLQAMTSHSLTFKVEDLVTKIKGLDDSLGALSGLTASPFHSDITYSAVTFKDAINSVTAAIGNTDIGSVINSGGNETLTNAIAQLYTDIGDVGAAGANIVASNYNASTTDLKKAVIAAAVGMTGSVEFDTAFHASNSGSLAEKAGYSATDLHAAIRELQTYVGNASTLSNSGDIYTVNSHGTATGTGTTTLNLVSAANAAVDVGYQVTGTGITGTANIVKKISSTSFVLDATHTVGTGVTITFTEPTGYGFADDVVTNALIELRTALVGGTADLTDKINTLDDADGAANDFNVTNVVDAIRELQDDIGQRTLITGSPFHSDINGTYNTTNIVTVLNAITAAIGSSDIGNPATRQIGLETITNAIKQIREDLGNVGPGARTVTTSGTTSTTTMVVNSTANLLVGMKAVHANITAGTTISSITNGTTLVLSAAPTSNIATSSTITFENSNLTTTADDVVNAINELEDDLYTSTSGSFTGLTSTHFKGAVEELRAELGDVTVLSDADGFTNTTAVGSIQELQIDVGNITPANMGVNTNRPKTLQAAVNNSTDLTLMNIHGISIGMKATHADIAAGVTVVALPDATTVRLNTAVTVATGEVINFKADNLQVKTRVLDENTGDVKLIDNAAGFDATTLVDGILELQADVGNVTAANLGTTSSTITTAIKEIVDGTGQAAVSVGATSISRDDANGGFLKKVKAGVGATAQTIVSNLNFNAAATTGDANKTTFTFGQNTVLDLSAATLITEAANADFETTAKKIVLGGTAKDGQGVEINRDAGPIVDAVGNLTIDPSLLWVDREVTAVDDAAAVFNVALNGAVSAGATTVTIQPSAAVAIGMVVSSSDAGLIIDGTIVEGISGNDITLSKGIGAAASSGTLTFINHNRSDLGWQVKGFKPSTNPSSVTAGYVAPNVDFYNAGRLFGKGTSAVNNVQTGVTVTWDPVNQHFDTTLQNSGVTAGVVGSSALVPVITVDSFGRITALTTANVSGSLGEFTLQGDSGGAQLIGVSETVKILGAANQIVTSLAESNGVNTLTASLRDSVTINQTLGISGTTVSTSASTGALVVTGGAGIGENLNIGGDLNVVGSITSGSGSFSFSSTSATVSSQQIILNALASNATADTAAATGQANIPAASFVAHRGFDSTLLSGNTGTLTKGKRYRINSSAASNAITAAEQAALKLVSGATDNHIHDEIITATTTGNSDLGGFSNIKLKEQNIEAKIAWNEASDQWELYRASETSNGAIVTQGDTFNGTLHANTLVTPSTNTNDENKELSFVDVSGSNSTLQKNSGLLYNPSAKHLKVAEAIGIGLTGSPDGTVPFTPEGMLHVKTNVDGKDASLILESDHDNDNTSLGELGNPVIQLIQDGRRIRSAIQMTGAADDGATGAKRNSLLFSTAAENAPGNAYMHFATGGAITVGSVSSSITVNSTSAWKTFNNVFLLNTNGTQGNPVSYGGFVGASVAGQKITFNDGAGTISLAPNTSVYSTGSLDDGNDNTIATDGGSGSGSDGGAFIHFNTFLEDSTWNGRTLTLSGSVDGYNIDNRYVAEVFIKYLLKTGSNYAEGQTVGANLKASVGDLDANGNFSLSLAIPPVGDPSIGSATPVAQLGFVIKGRNANAQNAFSSGDIDISGLSATVSAAEDVDQAAGNPTITTNPIVRMSITSETGNVGIATTAPGAKLDVHGNFRVEGDQTSSFPITTGTGAEDDDLLHTAVFASNNLSQTNSLSTTLNKQLKQAVFVSRPAYSGALSYLDITDVRTINSNNTLAGSAKRIQARTSTNKNEQGNRKGFISFPGNSNLVEIGGIHTNVDKVGVSTNSGGPTQIFHNIADATASSKKLETTTTGVEVSDTLYVKQFVGIGISNPINPLVVQGNDGCIAQIKAIDTGESQPAMTGTLNIQGYEGRGLGLRLQDSATSLQNSSSREWFVGTPYATNTFAIGYAADGVQSMYADQNKLTITDDGKVGIGTTAPTDLLTLSAPMAATPTYIAIRQTGTNAAGGGGGIIFDTSATDSKAGKYQAKIEGIRAQGGHASNELRFFTTFQTGANATLVTGQSDNPQQRMVIDQQGNVGIGTNTPDKAFHTQTQADITAGVNRQRYPTLHVAGRVKATHIDSGTIDTTGDIRIDTGTMNGALFVGEINAVDTGIPNNNYRHIYINAGESWALSDNADRIADQNTEKVYINAEYGLEVTSHPTNWIANAGAGTTAGWAGKNNPVKINQADGSSEFNQIKHTGLTMTSGTDIDQLYTLNFTPPTDNEWKDVGINSTTLATGTYLVQMFINEGNNGVYHEMYSGVMSWWAGSVNDDNTDEIFLHNAGHASQASSTEGNKNWYLRTKRILNTDNPSGDGYLKLQVRSSYTPPTNANRTYTIKLRRMI